MIDIQDVKTIYKDVAKKGFTMKIENYSIAMQSQQSSSITSVSHLFEKELFSLSPVDQVQSDELQIEELEKFQNIMDELEFIKRLEYTMVQGFMHMIFSERTTDNSSLDTSYNDDSFSNTLESSNIYISQMQPTRRLRELNAREVTLTKQVEHKECLKISMNGYIQTDTQKIKLDIDLSLSSTFVEKHQLTKTMFYDPLVLNFDGKIPNLDSKKFSFDIDCDGEVDQISKLSEGCGFLALDSNNNGSVDDGTELFGAQSGNGFYDLRRYDEDNNGWIDENDPILESLRIWKKTDTENELVALGELGIGAIYLGYTEEEFNIKTSSDEILGRIKSNGLFLNEDGSSGIVSQIDLAKEDSKFSELIQSAV